MKLSLSCFLSLHAACFLLLNLSTWTLGSGSTLIPCLLKVLAQRYYVSLTAHFLTPIKIMTSCGKLPIVHTWVSLLL